MRGGAVGKDIWREREQTLLLISQERVMERKKKLVYKNTILESRDYKGPIYVRSDTSKISKFG